MSIQNPKVHNIIFLDPISTTSPREEKKINPYGDDLISIDRELLRSVTRKQGDFVSSTMNRLSHMINEVDYEVSAMVFKSDPAVEK